MNMGELTQGKKARIRYWHVMIHQCEQSGMKRSVWCRQEKISIAQYRYWEKKIKNMDAAEVLEREEEENACLTCKTENVEEIPLDQVYKGYLDEKSVKELVILRDKLRLSIQKFDEMIPKCESHFNNLLIIHDMEKEDLRALEERLRELVLFEMRKNIIEVWTKDISEDYARGWFLLEDTLKTNFYYHLRRRLDQIFQLVDVMVVANLPLEETGKVADIAFVQLKPWSKDRQGIAADKELFNILAVFDLRLRFYGKESEEEIYRDQYQIRQCVVSCRQKYDDFHYYYIARYEDQQERFLEWNDQNTDWAQGCVTELTVSYNNETTAIVPGGGCY